VIVDLHCPSCDTSFSPARLGEPQACPKCGARIGRLAQLDQCLRRWYAPRRWRVDIQQPNVYFLLEKLWTAGGQGERLYQAISPRYTNFDIFRNMVTRKIAAGVEEGWVGLTFPEDPLTEDPVYRLEFEDPERFASEVERLFPEVDWGAPVDLPADALPAPAEPAAATRKKSRGGSRKS
jgi:hypothetical protein